MHTGEWEIGQPSLGSDVRTAAVRGVKEVWRYLPAWMFLFYGCLLLNTELTNLEPARDDLAYTAFFPMAVFALFYTVRALKAPDVLNRGTMLVVTVGLSVCLPLLDLAYHRPSPLALSTLRLVYELSNFGWAGLLVFHALR